MFAENIEIVRLVIIVVTIKQMAGKGCYFKNAYVFVRDQSDVVRGEESRYVGQGVGQAEEGPGEVRGQLIVITLIKRIQNTE